MAKIAGFFVTKNTVFQMTIDTMSRFFGGGNSRDDDLLLIILLLILFTCRNHHNCRDE